MLGSNDNSAAALQLRQPVVAVDRMSVKFTGRLSQANGIFLPAKIKKTSDKTEFRPGACSRRRGLPAIENRENDRAENNDLISIGYTSHARAPKNSIFGIEPPQIWPHLPALLVCPLPRFAALAVVVMPCAIRVQNLCPSK
jgi:hypothetical protein